MNTQNMLPNPRFYWLPEDKDFIVSTCHSKWPDEVKEVLHRSDLACANTFIFTHRWDMERCTEPVTFEGQINWNYRHHDDLEWLVMLNRARYMSELGQAYWLTNEDRYAAAYIRLMKDWIKQNPLSLEELDASAANAYNVKDTWRKLDSGIRITHWLKGYFCVRTSSLWTEEEENLFKEAVRLHGIYLNRAYTSHDRQSNWGYLETNGLFQLALLFPEFEESPDWLETAARRLAEMAPVQVFGDGMHNEQCTMYHHEVLHCIFESLWLGEINGYKLPDLLRQTLDSMYTATLAFVQPDGHQPMLGDSDGTDVRDVLSRGACLFERGDLKSQAYEHLDYEGIWYFGSDGYNRYGQLAPAEPAFCSTHLEDSGYVFMRSDWSADARYLLFDAGHMDVIRAHGHDDLLHFSLSAYGQQFLIDPGRYTYMENEERRYFMESLQHNTISVDGRTISEYVDSWRWNAEANPLGRVWRTNHGFDYAEAGHDGYWRLEQPVQIKRQIIFMKPDYWVVIDTLRSHGVHNYELPLHFAEGMTLTELKDPGEIIASAEQHGSCAGPSLRIIPVIPATVRFESSWVSRNYNEKTPAVRAVLQQSGQGLTRFVTLFYPERPDEQTRLEVRLGNARDSYGRELESHMATVVEIERDDTVDTLLVSHQGPKGYQFAGVHLSGEVIAAREQPGQSTRSWVLKI
ncbi:alginate lyase family protein [Paenibacillus sp. YPG26]|uniref:alginate lyase family protein n=1 Tax=Paenibacillus sp. YPG26 TaxID=2878915 RepID=UPI00203CF5D2|nr:alginate lyase family protein [Paenibacillus sp. YPG26]USB31945.1 heparinase II/III family protein [Paenibacillus sp. YPG26]